MKTIFIGKKYGEMNGVQLEIDRDFRIISDEGIVKLIWLQPS